LATKIVKMAKSIQISKKSTTPIPGIQSFKMEVQAINAVNMPSKIFIKQRVRNFAKDRFDDTFVAICTPVQLEDLAEDSPEEGTSYYRTDTIELVVRTAEMLQTVFDSLLYEVQKLVVDLQDIDLLEPEEIYTLSSDGPLLMTPTAPTITSIAGGDGELSVSFEVPISDGGSAILNYEYSINNGVSWISRTPVSPYPPIRIYGLSNSEIYQVRIRAVNNSGAGIASLGLYAAPAVPGKPSSPVITAVYTNENEQLVVKFNRPINLANSTISAYEYSLDAGETWQISLSAVGTLEIVVSDTVFNQLYNVTVRALTSNGNYGVSSIPVEYTRTGVIGSIFTGSVDDSWTNIANWLSATRQPATVYPTQYTSVTLESNCFVDVDSEVWVEPNAIDVNEYNLVFNSTQEIHPIVSCDITTTTGMVTFNGVDYGII
jgi:hypothetical protein